jgi:hypothetical protein
MDAVVPIRIQIISIVGSLLFLVVIGRLIVRGRLREEYAIVWLACTIVLLLLSVWRNGLEVLAASLGVFYAPSLLFLGACFAITIFLVHLSVVVTKLQKQNKILAQELALMRNELQTSKQPTL